MRNKVQTWIDSNACIKYLIPGDLTKTLSKRIEKEKLQIKLNAFNTLAVLSKQTTFLYSTDIRIKLLNKWFQRLNSHLISNLSSDWEKVINMMFFSSSLRSFSRGWDESEFPCIIQQLDISYNFSKLLDTFLIGGNDANIEEESKLRLILRVFFWEKTDEATKGAWLKQLLLHKNINYKQQAVLLYLILGPTRYISNSGGP